MSLLLAFVMLFTLLTACVAEPTSEAPVESKVESKVASETTAEPVVLTISHHMAEEGKQNGIKAIADAYTAQNPNIKFEISFVGMDSYMDTVKMKASADDAFDFIHRRPVEEAEFIQSGQILELDEAMFAEVSPVAIGSMKSDGKLYGIPLDIGGKGIVYNKDVFEQAGIEAVPTTWSELVEACEKIEAIGVTPVSSGFKEGWCIQLVFEVFLQGGMIKNNPDFFEKTMSLEKSFGDYPDFKAAMENGSKMLSYASENAYNNDYSKECSAVATGEAAMILQGTWALPQILAVNPEANLGYFPALLYDDASKNYTVANVDDAFMISAKSKHPEEAKAFAQFLMSAEASKIWAEESGTLPCVNGVVVDDIDPASQELLDILLSDKAVYYEEYINYAGQTLAEFNKSIIGWGAVPADQRDVANVISELDSVFKTIAATK